MTSLLGLNPCCFGISYSSKAFHVKIGKGLNPCCFGISYSRLDKRVTTTDVLILVVLGLVIVAEV